MAGNAAAGGTPAASHWPVVIVGAGPCGLTAAIGLARAGVRCLVLDAAEAVATGSRAICFAKRTLEVWDRLGCAAPMVERGVVWQVGRVFHRSEPVFRFDLLTEAGHRMPAFINLQQYLAEQVLLDRLAALPAARLHRRTRVTAVTPGASGVRVDAEGPGGPLAVDCDWLVACDGANSPVRDHLGLASHGQAFNDRFLIADIRMDQADFPTERWFWFDPPFHPGQSVLLHRQADNVWRVDFQLGPDADPDVEVRPESIEPRIRAMLGAEVRWSLVWASVYRFRCRMLDRLVHGRVLFAGDAAHQVSPFGARGANGGVQGVDNLVWKLARVVHGRAPASLLDSYDQERRAAGAENLLNSTRATDFISPQSPTSRAFRDATLALARDLPFARALLNSGRLSRPHAHRGSPLDTTETAPWPGVTPVGAAAPDAPIIRAGRPDWLLNLLGDRFVLLLAGVGPPAGLDADDDLTVRVLGRDFEDRDGLVTRRLGPGPGQPGACLFRPDQHLCARWRVPAGDTLDAHSVQAALRRARGCADAAA